jgi:hypothetical protein
VEAGIRNVTRRGGKGGTGMELTTPQASQAPSRAQHHQQLNGDNAIPIMQDDGMRCTTFWRPVGLSVSLSAGVLPLSVTVTVKGLGDGVAKKKKKKNSPIQL